MTLPSMTLLYVDNPLNSAAFYQRLLGQAPASFPRLRPVRAQQRLQAGDVGQTGVKPAATLTGGGGELGFCARIRKRSRRAITSGANSGCRLSKRRPRWSSVTLSWREIRTAIACGCMPSASSVVGIQVQARHQQPQRPGVGFVTVFHRVDVVVEQLANLRHCGAALCLTQGDQRQRAGMLHLFCCC